MRKCLARVQNTKVRKCSQLVVISDDMFLFNSSNNIFAKEKALHKVETNAGVLVTGQGSRLTMRSV